DGEVKVEPCADYRGGICVQSDIENPEKNKKFSISACVVNEASICINYNSKQDSMGQNCLNNSMCYLKKIDVDDGFRFDICLPQYPKGSDLSYEEGTYNLCSMANQKCTAIYEKKVDGWDCVYNCNCEKNIFSQQMNEFCTSLGDCGAKVNILGEGTDSLEINNAPQISWRDYIQYAKAIAGQFAQPKNLSDVLLSHASTAKLEGYDASKEPENKATEAISLGGTIVGGLGTTIGILGWAGIISLETVTLLPVAEWGAGGIIGTAPTSIAAFGTALGAFSVGVIVAQILTMAFGLTGQAAMIMAVAGVAAGVALAVIVYSGGWAACIGPQVVICAIIFIILIAIAIVLKVLGIGESKEVIASFTCLPWEAPVGADKCGVCNGDILKPCSKYRCESLGQACKLLNEDSENPSCEKIIDNHQPPTISTGDINYGYDFANEETWNVKVQRDNGNCIPEFAPLKFNLNTDEPAQCKYSFERTNNYEAMQNYPLDLNSYVSNHSFGIMMPSLNSLSVYDVVGDIRQKFGNMSMYIRCQDYYGDVNVREYVVNFCIESGPDLTAAYITKFTPRENGFIKYRETKSPLTIFLNEPTECKYDNEDKNYTAMKNSMECKTEITQFESFGWPCYTNLTGLTEDTNTIYIKCKDQPWFKNTANESQRNINTLGFAYTISKTKNPLKIDYIVPLGDIETGLEPMSIDFEVKTSEGAYYGDSKCEYNFDGSEKFVQFRNTFSNLHTQNINQLMNGPYIMSVKCGDEAGNIANGSTEINIKLDKNPPEVIRAYEEYGNLIIQTTEKAECYYSPAKCIFDIENATSMTTGFSTQHKTEWKEGITYYVKCIDIWGNRPDECSIKLLPSFFASLILNKFINKFIV
ncbi:MAG: hypothetical protein AABW88_02405, partial [Nanoarchaeota archaeon]